MTDVGRLVALSTQLTAAELTRLADLHLDAFTVLYNAAKVKKAQATANLRAELASIDLLRGSSQENDSLQDVTSNEDRRAW